MCGRFALVTEKRVLEMLFEFELYEELEARYNIAPSERILVLRWNSRDGAKELIRMTWGLQPPWVAQRAGGKALINARAETIAVKPAFRSAFLNRRALIPASGFYEWRREEKSRQPFFISLQGGRTFAFAALYEETQPSGSCAIITTAANSLIAPIHQRMPLIIPEALYRRWLDPQSPPEVLKDLLRPYPANGMDAYPVTRRVNSPAFDHPDCLKREV